MTPAAAVVTAALDALRARDWDGFARRLHPELKIVLEHITTSDAVDFVAKIVLGPPSVAEGVAQFAKLTEALRSVRETRQSGYACEMNFLFVYASRPSMPPSWP